MAVCVCARACERRRDTERALRNIIAENSVLKRSGFLVFSDYKYSLDHLTLQALSWDDHLRPKTMVVFEI